MPESERKKDICRDQLAHSEIIKEIDTGNIRLYRNLLKQPYAICTNPDFPEVHYHLHDNNFRGWITHFVFTKLGILIQERELDRIIEELAGRSLRENLTDVCDPDILSFIENQPVIAVVLEYVKSQTTPTYRTTMQLLWEKLWEFAKERRLLVLGKNRFPGGANVLSRRLKEMAPVLTRLGVHIDMQKKTEKGREVVLSRRSDDTTQEPSGQTTGHNLHNSNDIQQDDDRTHRLALLKAKKSRLDQQKLMKGESYDQ